MSLLNYYPAQLKTSGRWYVEFYQTNPSTKTKQRFREYHNLNRIQDEKERLRAGRQLVNKLNTELLPFGYPYADVKKMPAGINMRDAVILSLDVKCRSDRKKTISSYQTVAMYFIAYIEKRGFAETLLSQWGQTECMSFMDYLIQEKKPAPRTYNNYKMFLTSLWTELIDRGYIKDNPWSQVKKIKTVEKSRRMLSSQEVKAIFDEVYQNDKMLALSILLLYYCFIRPGEQRRLKVHMIDLRTGTINLPGYITKNKRSDQVTIPKVMMPFFEEIKFDQWHQDDFIFGTGVLPHPDTPCGVNTIGARHNVVVEKLYKEGKLRTKKGISIYSWKDTGAMALIKGGIDPYELMKQMRHADLGTTQKYLKSLENINKSIQMFSGDLIIPSNNDTPGLIR